MPADPIYLRLVLCWFTQKAAAKSAAGPSSAEAPAIPRGVGMPFVSRRSVERGERTS